MEPGWWWIWTVHIMVGSESIIRANHVKYASGALDIIIVMQTNSLHLISYHATHKRPTSYMKCFTCSKMSILNAQIRINELMDFIPIPGHQSLSATTPLTPSFLFTFHTSVEYFSCIEEPQMCTICYVYQHLLWNAHIVRNNGSKWDKNLVPSCLPCILNSTAKICKKFDRNKSICLSTYMPGSSPH